MEPTHGGIIIFFSLSWEKEEGELEPVGSEGS